MKENKQEGNLYNRLHTVRTRLGLSQRELALTAGVARQTIGGIEAGLFAPSAAVALRLAKALGCRVEDLFWLQDDLPIVEAILAMSTGQESESNSEFNSESIQEANSDAKPEGKGKIKLGIDSEANEALLTPEPTAASAIESGRRVLLAQVGGKWVAHPLTSEQAFRSELIPADGIAEQLSVEQLFPAAEQSAKPDADANRQSHENSKHTAKSQNKENRQIHVQMLDEPEALAKNVLLAGCAPALSLWARSAERWHPGLRVSWLHANSTTALQRLGRGEVHAAGVHLCDLHGGEDNAAFVQQIVGGQAVVLVTLGLWEEGLLVQPSNPHRLQRGEDLLKPGVTLVNREKGSGSRLLLDSWLQNQAIPRMQIPGYTHIVNGHQEVARAVQAGHADVGISVASVAVAYGLGFVPLRQVRYELALYKDTLRYEPVQQLLSTLRHPWILSQLKALGGYETIHTGEVRDV